MQINSVGIQERYSKDNDIGIPGRNMKKQNHIKFRLFCAIVLISWLAIVFIFVHYSSRTENYEMIKKAIKVISKEIFNTKWIVLTPKSHISCGRLKNMVKFTKSWQILVVSEYPSKCQISNVVVLFCEKKIIQNERKMNGYLYVIEHGAEYIFEADEYFVFKTESWSEHLFSSQNKYLVPEVSRTTFNPFSHFGQSQIWPRGFREMNTKNETRRMYRIHPVYSQPVVIHSMIEGMPDLHYDLKKTKHVQNIYFDETAPPFITHETLISPFPSKNTLFKYDAFWSLFLAPSFRNGFSDISRSFWAQKLLSLGNFTVAFESPNSIVETKRPTEENITSDYYDESERVENMADILTQWGCSDEWNSCIHLLTDDLVSLEIWKVEDRIQFDTWIHSLKSIGYKFPTALPSNRTEKLSKAEKQISVEPLIFFPIEKLNTIPLRKSVQHDEENIKRIFQDSCPHKSIEWMNEQFNKKSHFSKVALLVHYNHNQITGNLHLLKLLYKLQYPLMIICSNHYSPEDSLKHRMTLIPSSMNRNSMNCLTITAEIGFKIEGILTTHDDNILHPWHMIYWNRSMIWHTPPYTKECASGDALSERVLHDNGSVYKGVKLPPWAHIPLETGRIVSMFNEMANASADSAMHRCRINQINRLKKANRIDYGQGDHFYLPRRLFKDFVDIIYRWMEYDTWTGKTIFSKLSCEIKSSKAGRPETPARNKLFLKAVEFLEEDDEQTSSINETVQIIAKNLEEIYHNAYTNTASPNDPEMEKLRIFEVVAKIIVSDVKSMVTRDNKVYPIVENIGCSQNFIPNTMELLFSNIFVGKCVDVKDIVIMTSKTVCRAVHGHMLVDADLNIIVIVNANIARTEEDSAVDIQQIEKSFQLN
ncbi:putative glycosyltransferase STELLO2 [Nymphon striatum]|nr:putative glycosyltransferase STELLO2 [Nymphon striatum]